MVPQPRSTPAPRGGRPTRLRLALLLSLLGFAVGCDRPAPPAGPSTSAGPAEAAPNDFPAAPPGKQPSVASLVPAATDLIVAMGAGDHLVAVSTYDDQVKSLPRVGDYETIEWETIAKVRPRFLVFQAKNERVRAGVDAKCERFNISQRPVRFDRLADVYANARLIGTWLDENAKGELFERNLRMQFEKVRSAVRHKPRVKALLAVGEYGGGGLALAGPDNFLNDLLDAAGGDNAAGGSQTPWPAADREMLLTLRPEVIIHLLPGAGAEARERVEKFWDALPAVPAAKNKRVVVLRDWYVQQPGSHVGDLAEALATSLHPPKPPDPPTTAPGPARSPTRSPGAPPAAPQFPIKAGARSPAAPAPATGLGPIHSGSEWVPADQAPATSPARNP